MATESVKKKPARGPANQRRGRAALSDALATANRRAREHANRRGDKRGMRSVRAAIAGSAPMEEEAGGEWGRRLSRWAAGLVLLPICWVTTWTFLSRFSYATMHGGFWQTAEFWYFATGMVLMAGWFWSGLLRSFFLYLYVLGHELTHALFVVLHCGKVTDFHVSTSGGYITTNKSNLMIALSPYFVPIWSVAAVLAYVAGGLVFELSRGWELVFYGAMGLTWTFHMAWTVWMVVPRDQPDLKENGTFLSLVVIYFGNLLVLVGLLCLADGQLDAFREFGREWFRNAATLGDAGWRWAQRLQEAVLSQMVR